MDVERFSLNRDFRLAAVPRLATLIGIAHGIVSGRRQHERKMQVSRANTPERWFHFSD